jgi:hypothetical protein
MDQENRRHRYLLLSLGNDGKILVWELVSGQKELKSVKVLKLLTGSVPRSIRISRAKGDAEIGGEWMAVSNLITAQPCRRYPQDLNTVVTREVAFVCKQMVSYPLCLVSQ